MNLGYRGDVSDEGIGSVLVRMLDDPGVLAAMRSQLENCDFTQGKRRVVERIEAVLRRQA
jgi:hypothetical protein